jgi:hypothetical protein
MPITIRLDFSANSATLMSSTIVALTGIDKDNKKIEIIIVSFCRILPPVQSGFEQFILRIQGRIASIYLGYFFGFSDQFFVTPEIILFYQSF